MSDTPISDSTPHNVADLGMLCRRIERQLNAANERIKRLEEALESIREYWNRDNNERAMEDACWHAINTAAEALEAKEAKP
jgi:predicted phage tail protein